MASENTVISFVIKLWLEETAEESTRAIWRGRITHVATGRQQFIDRLEEASVFIRPYLYEMDVEPLVRSGLRHRLARWLGKRHGQAHDAAPVEKQ
jgi:hypothetical protein